MKIELAQIREKNCSKCVLVMMGIEVKKSIFGNFELLEKMSSVLVIVSRSLRCNPLNFN